MYLLKLAEHVFMFTNSCLHVGVSHRRNMIGVYL